MTRPSLQRLFPLICGGVLTTVFGWITLWWLLRNDLPDGYQNEFIHLYTLTEIFFRARDDSFAEAWPFLWGEYWPPGIHLTAASVMAVVGRSKNIAVLSLLTHLAVLLVAVSWAGQKLRDARTGLVAATLVASYPAIFGNLRRFEPNIALAAFVAAAALLLVVRGRLHNRRDAIVFGLLCSAGMLVDRVAFAVYLVPLVGVAFAAIWRDRATDDWRPALKRWGIVLGIGLLLCTYYYVLFFKNHVWEVLTQVEGEKTGMGETSDVLPFLSIRNLFYYPLSFIDCQMGLVLGAATGAGVALYIARGRALLEPPSRRMLEVWILFGLGLFTVVAKKQPFYSIPLLAPIALVAALGWRTVSLRPLRLASAAVVLFFAVHQVGFLTMDRGLAPTPGKWAWLAGHSPLPPGFLGYEYIQAAQPHYQALDLPRMVELCEGARDPLRPYVALFSEGQGAYEGQLMPTLRLDLDTRLVEGMLMTPEAFDENADHASCFIYVASGDHPWPTRDTLLPILQQFGYPDPGDAFLGRLAATQHRAQLIGKWTSKKDEVVHVYSLRSPRSPSFP